MPISPEGMPVREAVSGDLGARDQEGSRVHSGCIYAPLGPASMRFYRHAEHPLLGRAAEDGRRELIISCGRYGSIAKYRGLPAEDLVLILAVRHQREAGYAGD